MRCDRMQKFSHQIPASAVLTYLASSPSLGLKLRKFSKAEGILNSFFFFSWDVLDLKMCLVAQLPVAAGFWHVECLT